MGSIWEKRWLVPLVPVTVAAVLMLSTVQLTIGFPCLPLGISYGVWVDQCPATDLRLTVEVQASGLVRGQTGQVLVIPHLDFLSDAGALNAHPFHRGVGVSYTFLDSDENVVEGLQVEPGVHDDGHLIAGLTLPEVPDGDYILRSTVKTAFETLDVDASLPLYAPALTHLMTDRPLYKPGQDVLLRSVLLRRTDLAPLEQRPGTWTITDPSGRVLMQERDTAGVYGVADSSFPLDTFAAHGLWNATWESGDTRDSVSFEVRPFQLPRFIVSLSALEEWYGIGDAVRLEGTAFYTSGAPVANAPVTLRVSRSEGRWPAPLAWEKTFEARTDARGAFSVTVGAVPGDLIERNRFTAVATVTEEAGEIARGGASLIFSKDDLFVETVTELGDGLVEGFNNRAYLRVMTPAGKPLPDATLALTRPYDPSAPAREATTDEDGVAAFQLDPGAPVTVVIDPPPLRVRPLKAKKPSVVDARVAGRAGGALTLSERRTLERMIPRVAPCGDFVSGGKRVEVAMQVAASGTVTRTFGGDTPAARCVKQALGPLRFSAAAPRLIRVTWQVPDTLRPSLDVSAETFHGAASGAETQLEYAALEARRCLPRGAGIDGLVAFEGQWGTFAKQRRIATTIVPQPNTGLTASQKACIARSFSGLQLDDEAKDAIGTFTLRLRQPQAPGQSRPQAVTKTGYELSVEAHRDGARMGKTRLVLDTGTIPPLRLRASPSLASPGQSLEVSLLRGPSYGGYLPEKVSLMKGTFQVAEAPLGEDNVVRFTIPEDAHGFLHVEVQGVRTVVFVRPDAPLSVSLATDKATYRPGEIAQLKVTTRAGEAPVAAGVGLVGLDQALAELRPLLGPDDYGRVTVRAKADRPAFDSFDPRALQLGQIRGEQAAKAAVMRVNSLPMDPAGDAPVSVYQNAAPDVKGTIADAFYRVLATLVRRVRTWEETAPDGETMSPEVMAGLWQASLEELRAAGTPATDAFGRSLTLDLLPDALLVQVDPRSVVSDGTRLPEDVVSWTRYVREERAQ